MRSGRKRLAGILSAVLWLVCGAALFARSPDARDLYQAGKSAENAGDWYTAAEHYQEALHRNPAFFDAQFSLAVCFYELEEYDRALSCVLEAAKLRADSPDVLSLQGFILIGLGRLPEAETVFTRILQRWPNHIDARFGLGELDVAAGRISSAENQYMEALHRSPRSRKALLSLAVICQQEGKADAAAQFIDQALEYYGDNVQTLYIAGVFAAREKNYGLAERYLRSALAVEPENPETLNAWASVLYYAGRFREMNEAADRMIQLDRSNPAAWYQKTLALSELQRDSEAVAAARAGLVSAAEDEILRFFAEDIVLRTFALEDPARADWAQDRFTRADSFARHHMAVRALAEYRRGLQLNPYDTDARQAYASLLLAGGQYSRYLEEMQFIQSLGEDSVTVADAVENYGSLLAQSVAVRWDIDPLYVDMGHISVGIYCTESESGLTHPAAEETAVLAFADALAAFRRFSVHAEPENLSGYAAAFRTSRERNEDFFFLLSFEEGGSGISLSADLYVSRTGSPAANFTVSGTGNSRFSSSVRRLADSAASAFPVFGRILRRDQNRVVLDLGSREGVAVDSVLTVVPDSALHFAAEGLALQFAGDAALGTVTVSTVESGLSEGSFSRSGFFDRMNPGDFVVLQTENPEDPASGGGQTAGDAAAGAADRTSSAGSGSGTTGQTATEAGNPALFSLLRAIR